METHCNTVVLLGTSRMCGAFVVTCRDCFGSAALQKGGFLAIVTESFTESCWLIMTNIITRGDSRWRPSRKVWGKLQPTAGINEGTWKKFSQQIFFNSSTLVCYELSFTSFSTKNTQKPKTQLQFCNFGSTLISRTNQNFGGKKIKKGKN